MRSETALTPTTTTPAGAKSHTNSDSKKVEKTQAKPAFAGIYWPDRPVSSDSLSLSRTTKQRTASVNTEIAQRFPNLFSPLHHLFRTPSKPYRQSNFIPSNSWARSEQHQKNDHSIRTAQKHKAVAFSLNLSSTRIKTLLTSDDPTGRMAHEINRAMAQVGLELPYAFQFEFAPDTPASYMFTALLAFPRPQRTCSSGFGGRW